VASYGNMNVEVSTPVAMCGKLWKAKTKRHVSGVRFLSGAFFIWKKILTRLVPRYIIQLLY